MKTTDVLQWFDSNQPQGDDLVIESGRRGADVAYLHLSTAAAPERWAVVRTPGDRWFSVEVDGGFSLDHFEEGTPDGEALQRLCDYVDTAVGYLRQLPRPRRAGLLRVPVVRVRVNDEEVTLRLSLSAFLRRLARWGGTG